ncbi:MAG: threonine synthase [Bacteroidota bacterium]
MISTPHMQAREEYVPSAASHLYCPECGATYDLHQQQSYCQNPACLHPLLVAYHVPNDWRKEHLALGPASMWRYAPMLPLQRIENRVSLGEGWTPLLPVKRHPGKLWIKHEALNPSGSFKARGISMAISRAKELGVKQVVLPTAGNAGGAVSAYAARAGMKARVYMPETTPMVFQQECQFMGAELHLTPGSIRESGAQMKKAADHDQWFDLSTLKEPYRIEGKKTMGYEIAEQLQWKVPDVVIYPTGGGTGLIGIWKAFVELGRLGWTNGKLPRMVAVQASGCQPLVEAFREGTATVIPPAHPKTLASGLRVPKSFGDRLLLRILAETQGFAIAVSDEEILDGVSQLARREGIFVAPEGGATWMAYQKLLKMNWLNRDESVILLNTGSAYKYLENMV